MIVSLYFSKTNVIEVENVDRMIAGKHNNIFLILKDGHCLEYDSVYVIQAKEENNNGKEK